ncbi:MAG: hypothetical protein LCH61_19585 [Proteobacteria bacterium]|nr:hypothetical protein [Pseudomonadota bacterium]
MTRLVNLVVAAAFAASLAACATPPAPQADYTPPARKLDAKTQLETGRTR